MVDFRTIGVLGVGNMGGALVRGLVRAHLAKPENVYVYDSMVETMQNFVQSTGVQAAEGAGDLFNRCEVIVLAVKPQIFHHIAPGLRNGSQSGERTIISVMAGVTSSVLRGYFPQEWKVVRVMPNLPLSVGEGATAIEVDGHSEGTLLLAERIFAAAGRTARVSASQMDAVTGLSGSGPMYVFEFIEGLIAGGVKSGLPRPAAQELALQTVRGALKLLEDSGEHPSVWTARVCSPGGTTIHGQHVLENSGFKGILMAAVEAAVARSKALSQN